MPWRAVDPPEVPGLVTSWIGNGVPVALTYRSTGTLVPLWVLTEPWMTSACLPPAVVALP